MQELPDVKASRTRNDKPSLTHLHNFWTFDSKKKFPPLNNPNEILGNKNDRPGSMEPSNAGDHKPLSGPDMEKHFICCPEHMGSL
jgi:hypothetical protein